MNSRLLYPLKQKTLQLYAKGFFGGISWNRTSDTRIFSPLLYQLSYDTGSLSERTPVVGAANVSPFFVYEKLFSKKVIHCS